MILICCQLVLLSCAVYLLMSTRKSQKIQETILGDRVHAARNLIKNLIKPFDLTENPATEYAVPIKFDKLEFIRIADEVKDRTTIYTWHVKSHGINFWIKGESSWAGSYYEGYIEDTIIHNTLSWKVKEETENSLQLEIEKQMNFWADFANKYTNYNEPINEILN